MSIENLEAEIGTLRAKLAEAERERDQWKNAATARLALDERVRAIARMLGENPASVEAIESLGMRVNEAERVIARYRAALEKYAAYELWQIRDIDGELCEWIGGGEGPDFAERALAGAESEATDADQ